MTQGRPWIQLLLLSRAWGRQTQTVDLPRPAHNDLPLSIDSNTSPQPIREHTDGSDSLSHSTGTPTDSNSFH
jgi:hypothetical protein